MPAPPPPAHRKSLSQAVVNVPMWDSSDPHRSPAPLPLRPDQLSPISPRPISTPAAFDFIDSPREVSPIRRPRTEDFVVGGPLQTSPTKQSQFTGAHKRTGSTQPAPGVREIQNLFLGGGRDTSTPKNGTPIPKDYFGQASLPPLPKRDSFSSQYDSQSFRQSLDFEKAPELRPSRSFAQMPDHPPAPPEHTSRSLTSTKSLDFTEATSKMKAQDVSGLSYQLSDLTAIANNLQREMANLSRRSKDNATDLMSLKEATKNRDEDIRRSLRDLQTGLTTFEQADKLLENGGAHLSLVAAKGGLAPSVTKELGAQTNILERIMKDMSTKEDQDRAIGILNDINYTLKESGATSEVPQKILSMLEEIKDKEDSRGKELVVSGPRMDGGPLEGTILTMLDDLRQDIRRNKSGEQEILSMLDELRAKETEERKDDRILSILDELKVTTGDERLDRILLLLEDLRDSPRDDDRVASMLEDVKKKMESMNEEFEHRHGSSSGPSSHAAFGPPLSDAEALSLLRDVKAEVDNSGEVGRQVKRLLDNCLSRWDGLNIKEALKDLGREIDVLATEQRRAQSMKGGALSGPVVRDQISTLATRSQPFGVDPENDAAITALASIASTTTRTDITLSSINALLKVFQKEAYSSSNNASETLSSIAHVVDDLNTLFSSNTVQTNDIRKVLEVVRTGISSANDRLAVFESQSHVKIDILCEQQKLLSEAILGEDDDGMKYDVEELTRTIEGMKKLLEAIGSSNPAHLIAELKSDLGAMAMRSLDAFKNSESAVQKLREDVASSVQKSTDQAATANEFRTEVKETLAKSISISEAIHAKSDSEEIKSLLDPMKQELAEILEKASTASASQADVKAALDSLKDAMKIEVEEALMTAVSLASRDEKTAEALNESTTKILEPIAELRKELNSMVEKTSSALSAPVSQSDTQAIKERIEALAKDLMEAMEKTSLAASELSNSSTETDQKVTAAIEGLRNDIAEIGKVVAASSSANSVEQSMERLRTEVVEKLTARDSTKDALDDLKSDIADRCVAAAVAALNPEETQAKIEEAFVALKGELAEKMEKSLTPSSGASEIKGVVENLVSEVREMMERNSSALVQPVIDPNAKALKDVLETMKTDIALILEKTFLATSGKSSDETRASVEELRKDIKDLISQTSGMLVPMQTSEGHAGPTPALSSAMFDKSFETFKTDVNEMVEKSLAAAIASSTFDSEENVKQAIEKLKSELKDVVGSGDSHSVREAIDLLRQELFLRLERGSAGEEEEREDLKRRLDSIKGQFGEFLEKSSSVEIKEAVDALRATVDNLARKPAAVDLKEVIESLKVEMASGNSESPELMGAVEALKSQVELLSARISSSEPKSAPDSTEPQSFNSSDLAQLVEVKQAVNAIKSNVESLIDINADAEIKEELEGLRAQVESLISKGDQDNLLEAFEALKGELKTSAEQLKAAGSSEDNGGVKALLEEFRTQVMSALGSSTEKKTSADTAQTLQQLKTELREAIHSTMGGIALGKTPIAPEGGVKDSIKGLRKEVKELMSKMQGILAANLPEGPLALPAPPPDVTELKEALNECRLEVAVVKAVVEDKSAELREGVADVTKSATENSEVVVEAVKALIEDKIAEVVTVVAGLEVLKKEDLSVITEAVEKFQAETKEAVAVLSGANKRIVDDLSGVKDSVDTSKESLEVLGRSLLGAKSEFQESMSIVHGKIGSGHAELKETVGSIKDVLGETQGEVQATASKLEAAIETCKSDVKAEVGSVKVLVEESQSTAISEHERTQQQVADVLLLVDSLQQEWKGAQPNLFKSLGEMRQLMIAAQSAAEAARKAQEEAAPPPPAYDDAVAQDKLDQILSENRDVAKHLPQLALLDSIQKQVNTTSADIAKFLAMQRDIIQDETKAKQEASTQAQLDLERAIAEKKAVEAATASLRHEYDRLLVNVEDMREESDVLFAKKLQLSSEIGGLESALVLRKQELERLESRGEALERRMLEGVIEQSRLLLTTKKAAATPTRKPKSSSQSRRHVSASQMDDNGTPIEKPGLTRGGSVSNTIGLGQREHSLGLGRSQSVKQTSFTSGRQKQPFNFGKENSSAAVREEEVDELEAANRGYFGSGKRGAAVVVEEDDDSDNGSVVRMNTDVDSKQYPGLGLDFSEQGGYGYVA